MSQSMRAKVKVPGKSFFDMGIGSGTSSVILNINPTTFDRLSLIGPAFEYYRFTKLSVKIQPAQRSAPGAIGTLDSRESSLALGYLPEQTAATSTTISLESVAALDASECFTANLYSESGGSITGSVPGTTVPTLLRVPKRVLLDTPTKWFRYSSDSVDTIATQGQLILASRETADSTNVFVTLHVSYVCEFAGGSRSSVI